MLTLLVCNHLEIYKFSPTVPVFNLYVPATGALKEV